MYSCNSQSFLLEHFLRIDTSKPENWLSALQILTASPRISRKILAPKSATFRARLSFLQSNNLNVLGSYLHNPSLISGANAESATIVMPVEGTVDFQVGDGQCLCGPFTPFLLETGEEFHASLSEETHLLIIQLRLIKKTGYRAVFQRQKTLISELVSAFLYETPFFRDYKHATDRLEDFSAKLYEIIDGARPTPKQMAVPKKIRDERRLCSAIHLLNDELDTEISIESIASRSGLSLRNLHYLMKQYIGQSPYQYLRSRRLIKAREAIIRDYPAKVSIAQQALRIGFQHAGRFSAYYHRHFNEYPNQTLGTLDQLKQMADSVKSLKDDSGEVLQYWLTSAMEP